LSDASDKTATPPAPPANAVEARARLDAFVADLGKGAKLLARDPETTKEFKSLSEMASGEDASTVAAAIAGNPGDMLDSQLKMMANTAGMLRDIGIKEGIIKEVLQGHLVSAEEFKLTEAWKARQMKDPVFVRSYLSGEPEAREKMVLADIILSGGIKGQSASSF
jgi:hypothetical protein